MRPSLLSILLLATLPALAQYPRVISFSGYQWSVKTSTGRVGPGPNYFSDSTNNVWVDADGYLHLKITKSGHKWYAAEVINKQSLGRGTYRFHLASPVDNLDPNAVLGLFTWNDAPDYNHREIDIEFARWGNARDRTNAQFVVQPYDIPGNLVRFVQPPNTPASVHSFQWNPGSVYHRAEADNTLIAEHTFTAYIPEPGGENARMNLWLFRGRAPKAPVEVVISRFEFVPLP